MLHGANRFARLLSIKGGPPPRLEYKATTGVLLARHRAGMSTATPCSVCGRPAAVVSGGLRAGERLICRHCVEEAAEGATTDADTSVLSADNLVDAYRLTDVKLTSEEEYAEALDTEQEWHLLGDGTLARGSRNPWGGDRGAAWRSSS